MDTEKDNAKETKDEIGTREGFYRFVFLKAEKLTSALYLVSDFLSDNEPLKWRMRARSLDLVSETSILYRDKKEFFNSAGLGKIQSTILDILSLLQIAGTSGWVSEMNFKILNDEYRNLFELIGNRVSEHSLRKYLIENRQLNIPLNYAQENKTPDMRSSGVSNLIKPSSSPIRQNIVQKDSANDLYGLNVTKEKKSLRIEQIMNFLKDKDWTSITDIASALPGTGSKTVQRELQAMVTRRILLKKGERRWSKYRLS